MRRNKGNARRPPPEIRKLVEKLSNLPRVHTLEEGDVAIIFLQKLMGKCHFSIALYLSLKIF